MAELVHALNDLTVWGLFVGLVLGWAVVLPCVACAANVAGYIAKKKL